MYSELFDFFLLTLLYHLLLSSIWSTHQLNSVQAPKFLNSTHDQALINQQDQHLEAS